MEKNYSLTISKELHEDVVAYCKLNNIDDVEKFKSICFVKGYNVDKYGLFGDDREINVIEHNVVKEVPVEIIKEVIVEKIINDDSKIEEIEKKFQKEKEELLEIIDSLKKESLKPTEKEKMLSETIQSLGLQVSNKDNKIKGLEDKINYLSNIIQNKLATYHPSSNLRDRL